MARYEHLPIYKAAPDLTVHLEKLVAGFSRRQDGGRFCRTGAGVIWKSQTA